MHCFMLGYENYNCLLIYYPVLQSFFTHIFNGCYAVLLFIVVVFFLIYGVEVYFKVGSSYCNKSPFR